MAPRDKDAAGLAHTLRAMREKTWPDIRLTQAQLAAAFSTESPVAAATISTWESATSPKSPNAARLRAYARFFATRRSVDDGPRLIPENELTESEQMEFRRLDDALTGTLHGRGAGERPGLFTFAEGPVTIICPDAPPDARGPLAHENHPDFTKLHRYTDQDALIEIHGHVRAMNNPSLEVFHRLASEARADDISTHVILLGGVAFNAATRRFQDAIGQVPVTQVTGPKGTFDPFSVTMDGSTRTFEPQWQGEGDAAELVEDVGLLVRLPNPFNSSRTLTICNGVYGRGVLGAVRCLTDAQVRDRNEGYLGERFATGTFALLMRVPVVTNKTISPDLQTPRTRLVEWSPGDSAA